MNGIEEPECSICFNKIGERNKCITPCGHSFCFTCIIEVIRHDNNTCPNCRALFIEETIQENIINPLEENYINYDNILIMKSL